MRWVQRESRSGLLFRDLSTVCGAAETTRGNSQEPDFRMRHHERPAEPGWRFRLHEIVFEAETRGGKLFDVLLLTAIVSSVAAVMLESVPSIRARHGAVLLGVEWGFTLLFTVEYAVRLVSVRYPSRYALSFFGGNGKHKRDPCGHVKRDPPVTGAVAGIEAACVPERPRAQLVQFVKG